MSVKSKIQPGDVYNSWTVVSRTADRRRVRFICQCVCGTVEDVLGQNLVGGTSKQCRPCANHDRAHLKDIDRDVYNRLYHQARGAVRRCLDLDNEDYGGRGISVYHVWVTDLKLFVEYLITLPGHADPLLVIDRINNNGNYEPGNLRFATWSESNYNRRLPSEKRRVI